MTNSFWGEDWVRVRAMWGLDPERLHLNHGSFGAMPGPVVEAQRRWRRRLEANPVRFFRELGPAVEAVRLEVAAFLCADPDGTALVTNATTGANAVLASFPLGPGDEVLVTDHGYGAVTAAATRVCAGAGARLTVAEVPLEADGAAVVERVLDAVTERTRLALVDQITSPTARLFPVAELVAALHERGVAVLVDGAHGPGMIPVDLGASAPDFWVGNLHKWVCAPPGSAALYVAREWRARIHALVVSWREDEGFPCSFSMGGTADLTPWLAAPAALALFAELGWDRVRAHNRALAAYGQSVVGSGLGVDRSELLGDEAVCMRLVPLPHGLGRTRESAHLVRGRIADELGAETAVSSWNGRGLLRLSAHVYNSPQDYERLADRLPQLLDEQRQLEAAS
jgi:isopenicillin-N epimerase